MIKIRIADVEKELANADEQWINQQINRRQADGQTVCVMVTVHEGGLDMVLTTPTCGTGGSGGRPPRPDESRVFDLWKKRGLDGEKFTGGDVVAFLKQLQHLL